MTTPRCFAVNSLPTAPTGPSGMPGDAGATPKAERLALAEAALTPALRDVPARDVVNLGLAFCSDVDRGTSIAAEAKTTISDFRAQGFDATDAEEAFWVIASGATGNGDLSFCKRHADKVDAYNNSQVP